MTNTTRTQRLLSLRNLDWRFQERQRGTRHYTTYRNGRPYVSMRQKRNDENLKETWICVALLIMAYVVYVMAGTQ